MSNFIFVVNEVLELTEELFADVGDVLVELAAEPDFVGLLGLVGDVQLPPDRPPCSYSSAGFSYSLFMQSVFATSDHRQ